MVFVTNRVTGKKIYNSKPGKILAEKEYLLPALVKSAVFNTFGYADKKPKPAIFAKQ
uniref:Uncharacterized protein n=1 Tax=Utricularia reniformis TaxID=192314 RepID=A0A1Y0AZB8_9LAMI|nr:hypothetical protein AEK19_MT0248 [Utricularia reniformis]ART30526.1 hypothetical protein AEK19_MT0248 [Utricularia reniformis]